MHVTELGAQVAACLDKPSIASKAWKNGLHLRRGSPLCSSTMVQVGASGWVGSAYASKRSATYANGGRAGARTGDFLTIKVGWKRHRSAYPCHSKKSWSFDRASTVVVNSRLPPIATSIPRGRHPRNIANSLQTERRPVGFYVWPASAPRCSPQSRIHSSPPPLHLAPRFPRPHYSPWP
jgi:hypothetical protein